MVCSIIAQSRPLAVVPPGMVNVVHDLDMPLAGFTVAEIQFGLRDVLNVGMDALAFVGGRLAPASYRLRPGQRLEFMRAWGRKGANPAYYGREAIDRINQTPMPELRFRDFLALKSGRDRFSNMSLPVLREAVPQDVIAAVTEFIDEDDEDLQARCYRWFLRGLEVERAIRKVLTDAEVGENAREAWLKNRRPWR